MLEFSHAPWMVAASFAVALAAGFSGLSLLRGASQLSVGQRQLLVTVAAVVLGGGIWSMHFVAMLGLQLPVLFYYDGLTTLVSALVAILMVGFALLVLHFGRRTRVKLVAAGCIMGVGITAMHYIGMLGMELCGPVFLPLGVVVAVAAALALSNLAVWVAYGSRTRGHILLGTLCFAIAVVSMHFIAMGGTQFFRVETAATAGPALSNAVLAMLVSISSFVISGVSLLSGVSFFDFETAAKQPVAEAPLRTGPAPANPVEEDPHTGAESLPVPYEKDGRTHFVESTDIAAIRAEGHYTVFYSGQNKHFCPWSISEADGRLGRYRFIRVHRSYLVNPAFVSEFQRTKDTGLCFFEGTASLAKVPVSRSRLAEVKQALGV